MRERLRIIGISVFLLLGLTHGFATGADYPARPITMINPQSPGGSNDVIGRMFCAVAQKHLGQPLVMLNKAGGRYMIGTLMARDAKPDGYTMMLNTSSTSAVGAEEIAKGKEPPFRWEQFIPLGSVTNTPSMLCVPYESPWKTVGDFIKDVKAKPKQYKFCSSSLYSGSHMPMALVIQATGIDVIWTAYQGGGPCIAAMMGKHFDFTTQFPSTTSPLVKAKKMRWLATSGEKRLNLAPEIPTFKEEGINAVYSMMIGFFTQKKSPEPVIQKLRDVVYKVAHDPQFISMLLSITQEVDYRNPEEQMKYMTGEVERFARVIKSMEGLGLK
jgi:tripartite-type tricarboxylate transporter receptor subunit TctC